MFPHGNHPTKHGNNPTKHGNKQTKFDNFCFLIATFPVTLGSVNNVILRILDS